MAPSFGPSLWDRQQKWLWLIAFVGGLIFVSRDAATVAESPVQMGVIHRALAMVILFILILPWALRRQTVILRGIIGLLILFSCWQLVSVLWSVNPLFTFLRSAEYMVVVVLTAFTAFVLRDLKELQKWMNWVWLWIGFLVIIVWFGALAFPDQAFTPASYVGEALIPVILNGVFPQINANSVSTYGAALALVGISRWLSSRGVKRWWIFLTLLALITMVVAQSRSAIAGFALGVVLLLLFHKRFGFLFLLAVLVVACALTPLERYFQEFYLRGGTVDLFWTFSGRLPWWEFAWENFIGKDPIGYGAYAGERIMLMQALGAENISGVHSTWVEVSVGAGIPGILLVLLALLWTWKVLLGKSMSGNPVERAIAIEIIAVLALMTVRSLFTTAITVHNDHIFFLSVGCAVFFVRPRYSKKITRYNAAVSYP